MDKTVGRLLPPESASTDLPAFVTTFGDDNYAQRPLRNYGACVKNSPLGPVPE